MLRGRYSLSHGSFPVRRPSYADWRASLGPMSLGFCMMLFHGQSFAEDNMTASLAKTPDALPEVVVQSHYDNAIGTTDAASQGTVNGVLLQDIPLLRPGEVLETVPGLVVTQHSGDGKANQYYLRGYNLDHGHDLASFVDGVPVNMPTNAHGQGYTDLNFLIPELVDRINYLKGPYFASQGDFSAAGAVDIHYKNTLPQNLIDVTLGEDDFRRVLAAGSGPLGAIAAGNGASTTDGGPVVMGALELLEENGPWVSPEVLRKKNALLRLSDG